MREDAAVGGNRERGSGRSPVDRGEKAGGDAPTLRLLEVRAKARAVQRSALLGSVEGVPLQLARGARHSEAERF